MLEDVLEFDNLLFVDASIGVGSECMFEIHATNESTANFHHLTPQLFLSLLSSLYNKTPKAFVITAYFETFEIGIVDSDFFEKTQRTKNYICAFLKYS